MKIIVVEDERIIREGLVQMIREMEDVKVVAACENAVEGYAKIMELRPDVVVSDIVMDDETGIDMIARCKDAGIDCEFVLISGYSEFEYARSALRLGVFDYLNKPLDAEKLNNVMKRLHDCVAQKRQNEDRAIAYYAQSRNAIDLSVPESLKNNHYYVICINIFNKMDGTTAEQSSILIEKACYEAVRDYRRLLERDGMSYLLLIDQNDRDSFTHELITQVMCRVSLMEIGLHLGVSACFDDVHLLNKAIREATAAEQHAAFCDKLIVSVDELDYAIAENAKALILRNFTDVRPKLQGMDANTICKAVFAQVDSMYSVIPAYAIFDFFRLCVQEALFSLNSSETDASKENILAIFQQAVSLEHLKKRFKTVLDEQLQLISLTELQDSPDALSKAKQYINLHYTENLSGEMVARMFFMDPAYFSKRFKKVYGVNYNDYIFTLRMEKAKQLLMLNSYTVAEVAEHVGYQSAKYFSKMFRKHTGLLPSEFYDKKVHPKDKTT